MVNTIIDDKLQDRLTRAQSGDKQEADTIMQGFLPLIKKYQYINKRPDEDLLCELYLAAFLCIMRFKVDEDDLRLFLSEARRIIK